MASERGGRIDLGQHHLAIGATCGDASDTRARRRRHRPRALDRQQSSSVLPGGALTLLQAGTQFVAAEPLSLGLPSDGRTHPVWRLRGRPAGQRYSPLGPQAGWQVTSANRARMTRGRSSRRLSARNRAFVHAAPSSQRAATLLKCSACSRCRRSSARYRLSLPPARARSYGSSRTTARQ